MILLCRDVHVDSFYSKRGLLQKNNGSVNFWLILHFFIAVIVNEEAEVGIPIQQRRNSPVAVLCMLWRQTTNPHYT
jgi:hypothetical protein